MSWENVKLGDVCTKIGSGATPKGGSTVYVDSGTSFIRSQNVYNLKFDYSGLVWINEEAAKKLNGVTIQKNDVLLNITGDSVARTCVVPDEVLPARVNQHVAIVRPDSSILNPYFLNYYLASPYMQSFMLGLAVGKGASRNAMTKDMISGYEVPCPPLDVQLKIVDILKTYDSLIENNQKQIKLLEEAAQRLYKEWFVDLRFPGYESVEIVDGVPKGWEKCELNDFCYVTDGTHDSPKPKDYGIPLVTGKCIKNGYIDYSEANLISAEDHDKITKRSGLKTGDILFSNIGTIGSTCRVDYDREFSVKNVIIIKPDTVAQTNFLYCWINSRYIQDSFLNQTNGSSQQFIGLSFMRKFGILIPTNELIEKFNDLVSILFMRKDLLHRQTEQLGEMRDRLLPKLMSGEIEV